MISQELLRFHQFFSDFEDYQLKILTHAAKMISVDAGHYFFHEREKLDKFYFLLDGKADILVEVPTRIIENDLGWDNKNLYIDEVPVASVDKGEMFAWSALIPPHKSTAAAKSRTECIVIEFDCNELRTSFEKDSRFAYLITQKAAQTIRERLRCLRTESLAYNIA